MHSITKKLGSTEYTAYFNGSTNYSAAEIVELVRVNSDGEKRLHVPLNLLLAVVATFIRNERVSALEQASDVDILRGVAGESGERLK